jgi:hypothetical protein
MYPWDLRVVAGRQSPPAVFELTLYETYSLIASPGTEGLALLQWCDYDLCRDVSLALIEKICWLIAQAWPWLINSDRKSAGISP